jgi:methylthioribose-1-phosphate isomerase
MQANRYDSIRPVRWTPGGLELIDQRKLPAEEVRVVVNDVRAVASAITDMVVRGAPAIGVTAGFGVAIAVRDRYRESPENWREVVAPDLVLLKQARPTAVNLAWAVERMQKLFSSLNAAPMERLFAEAQLILDEDVAANRRMGELGAALIEKQAAVLTHCNAGALATGGYGTALGVVRSAFAAGKISTVFADETRPWLQGSRLTAWELLQDKIPVNLIADGAAGFAMQKGRIEWVIVGADRVAANGDVANKIGTYGLAVNARHHGVKFMVVAPSSTIDLEACDGSQIPIEMRDQTELLNLGGSRVAATGAQAWNPVFDITPAELVDTLVTEYGVLHKPTRMGIAELLNH